MLEGKEISGDIGKYGTYGLDISENGDVEIAVGIKLNLFDEAIRLSEGSENKFIKMLAEKLKALRAKTLPPVQPPQA